MATERELELLAVIEKAPHAAGCQRLQVMPTAVQIVDGTWQDGDCTCWKSSVDTSALAERDAETRRKALEEARAVLRENTALSLYEPHELTNYGKGERKALELADARLRALAEGGENRG